MRTTLILAVVTILASACYSQEAPYDKFPDTKPPYYRVRIEPSNADGELRFGVNYCMWIPEGVETLRGIVVHQHGCGEGSCTSGLTGAYDLHWQALAKKHSCALLSPTYEQPEKSDCQLWFDPRNGSDAAFQKSLHEFAIQTGHSELTTIPWALWGHSGGGHWCGGMVMLHPDRVVAAWLRSGVPLLDVNAKRPEVKPHVWQEAVASVPMMCNLGVDEGVSNTTGQFAGVWPSNKTFFSAVRKHNGLIAVAIDPLSSHECGNQRYLAIPWLDACLQMRLPDSIDEPLTTISPNDGVLVPTIANKNPDTDKAEAEKLDDSWLPSSHVAALWQSYIADTNVPDTTDPPPPYDVQLSNNRLVWKCDADMESGLAGFIIVRDGIELISLPQENRNPFGRNVFQGLQYSDTPPQPIAEMEFTDETAIAGKVHTYEVIARNTVGLKSQSSSE
jgi:hypothetical protein